MATKPFIDGVGAVNYRKGTGDGSSGDPFIPEYLESNSGGVVSALASILAKLSDDPATQTTLAAVLAKLSSDPATQTTLAAVLSAVQGTLTVAQFRPSGIIKTSGVASSSTQELVAAQGSGNELLISHARLQNGTTTDATLELKFGSGDSDPIRIEAFAYGGGESIILPPGTEWAVGDNTALVLDMSPATDIGYTIFYRVV